MGKYTFVILCNPEDLPESIKVAHALHYAVQLKRSSHEVVVYFDVLGSRIPISDSPYKGLRQPMRLHIGRASFMVYAAAEHHLPPQH